MAAIDTEALRRQAVTLLPINKVLTVPATVNETARRNVSWVFPGVSVAGLVFVGYEPTQIRKDSLLIDLRIEERSVAEFTVSDILGVKSYARGQPVLVFDYQENLLFGGVIDTPEAFAMAPAGGLYHPLRCMDWHYLADKRLVAASYENKTCGYIVEDIRSNYLHAEGVTAGNIELGPTLIQAVFNYVRASDCFDALAVNAGKIWFIDEHKRLYFQDRDTTAAPWSADAATNIDNCLKSGGNPKYRNRQYIRGGKATTSALQTETFVADGEQNAFTLSFPIAKVPTSIKIDGGDALTMGIKGLDAPGDFEAYWSKGDATIFITTAPADTEVVEVKYYGLYDILILVEDDDAIAAQFAVERSGTGYVDDISDEPKLTEKAAIFDSGKAKLAKFTPNALRFQYTTVEVGLRPGQLQPVTSSGLGLSADNMLIEAVSIRRTGTQFEYSITAIQGPGMGNWTDFFRGLAAMKQEVIERLNVGSEQILIILAEFDGYVVVSEAMTDTVFACFLVGEARVGEATVC